MTRKKKSNAIVTELLNLGMITGGVVVGSMAGKAIDKVLKVDATLPGFQAKKLAKPALQLGAGIVGAWKSKNENIKRFAAGVGASGVISAVSVATNKNLLAGLPALGTAGLARSVYEEGAALSVGRYTPDLPQLNAGDASLDYSGQSTQNEFVDADFEII
jgi:hypothetical protein